MGRKLYNHLHAGMDDSESVVIERKRKAQTVTVGDLKKVIRKLEKRILLLEATCARKAHDETMSG
jgi:hypothetical protein